MAMTFNSSYGEPTDKNPTLFGRTIPFSICVWINPTDVSLGTFWRQYGDGGGAGGNGSGWVYAFVNNTVGPGFILTEVFPTNAIYTNANTPISLNVWSHICYTYDGSSTAAGVKAYLNGVAGGVTIIFDSLTSGLAQSTILPTFGQASNAAGGFQPFLGDMDDIRIYNRVLSAAEIATIYACRGSDGIRYGLVSQYTLEDLPPGTTAASGIRNSAEGGAGAAPFNSPVFSSGIITTRRRNTA